MTARPARRSRSGMHGRVARTATGALIALVALAGCAASDDADVLTVHAAASLANAMDDIEADFEAANPGIDVRVNVGGSSGLATQILEGAGGDVFASADLAQMERVDEEDLAPEPIPFAANTLTIAVPPGNPNGIADITDLANPELDVVMCAPQVPCGAAAARTLDAAGVSVTPVSEELAVTDVMAKVTSGQADAGLVYVTDVIASDGAAQSVPPSQDPDVHAQARTVYPIARLSTAANPTLADTFVAYVLSGPGQATLAEAGFESP